MKVEVHLSMIQITLLLYTMSNTQRNTDIDNMCKFVHVIVDY